MLFNSVSFLLVFLPVAYVVYWALQGNRSRHVWLALAGYVFYSFWDWRFCFVMLASTLVSFFAGRGLLKYEDDRLRRLCVVAAVAYDLVVLGIFKYADFGMSTINLVGLRFFGSPPDLPLLELVLPLGISFYTFHTISYVVDGYRRAITPTRDFWAYATYVSFFPQLVAGPIVRYRQINGDLLDVAHAEERADARTGWALLIRGLAKKVLLADVLGAMIDPGIEHITDLSTTQGWLVALGFTYQLYFDFSGYSDMAIGLALMFGLHLPQNFNAPYKATSLADFWRRWHMSLSSFLRDYVYIPLGGNRFGTFATYRNLFLTMLLGGLWHGANWTFVVWGAYHGAWLCMLRRWEEPWKKLPPPVGGLLTFLIVILGWVVFRSPTLDVANAWLGVMFSAHAGRDVLLASSLPAWLLLAALLAHLGWDPIPERDRWTPARTLAFTALLLVTMVGIYGMDVRTFLYYQF